MRSPIFLLLLSVNLFAVNNAKAIDPLLPGLSPQQAKVALNKLKTTKSSQERSRLYLDLAHYYLYTEKKEPNNQKNADVYIQKALVFNQNLQYKRGILEAEILKAISFAQTKRHGEAGSLLKNVISEGANANLKDLEGWAWFETAMLEAKEEAKLKYLIKAEESLKQSNDRLRLASIYKWKGWVYYKKTDYQPALDEYMKAWNIYSSLRYKKITGVLNYLALLNNLLKNRTEALKYGLMAIESTKEEDIDLAISYSIVGNCYRVTGNSKDATDYLVRAQIIFEREKNINWLFYNMSLITNNLIDSKQEKTALDNYIVFTEKYPAKSEKNTFESTAMFLRLYTITNMFRQADSTRKEMVNMYKANKKPAWETTVNTSLAEFYFQFKDYEKAKVYYLEASRSISPPTRIAFRLSMIDSIAGDYKGALSHYKKYKSISDSLQNENRTKMLASMELSFKVKENKANLAIKEAQLNTQDRELQVLGKDALLLKQNATLLNKEAKLKQNELYQAALASQKTKAELILKDRNIQLLNKKSELHQSEIRQQALIKNIVTALVIMFALVIALLWRQFRSKQKTNKLITQKNQLLQDLLSDKSWLLKEMHHRVKNNLHTVISLLESQSAYLKTDALYAIKNSQHRIYAMSLIHQKLYQSDDVKTIDMAVYIPDLVVYLKESLEIRSNIQIIMDIDPIEFEIAEAVPLGLIINEGVTNSLKYAFLGREKGQVSITLKKLDNSCYQLILEDDGIGLPVDFELKKVLSLGMKLIKGLTEQLEGILEIKGKNGTRIMITSIVNNVLADTNKAKEIEELIN
ncbi:sensor histidine kinase [Pedobacter psychrodurus]|uniref:histidine kinase n=1 Tax=Pedobacter psychrodurus TaxID=2530456 RepID=A0A4R0Q5B0_9SPHI|nr:sensor histidine kinase [Pedobacter psychrodurus]TCD26502.1 sensor histidine kinase [Pedobacter psychrodurus]